MKAAATVTIPFLMAAQLAAAAAVPSVINILKPLERCGDGCVRVRVDSKPLLRGAADRIIIAGNLFQKSSKSDDSLRFEYKSVYAPSTTATLRLSEAGEIVRGRIAVSVSASAISGMEQKERAVAEIHAHYDDDSEIRHVLRMIPENSPVVDSGQEREEMREYSGGRSFFNSPSPATCYEDDTGDIVQCSLVVLSGNCRNSQFNTKCKGACRICCGDTQAPFCHIGMLCNSFGDIVCRRSCSRC